MKSIIILSIISPLFVLYSCAGIVKNTSSHNSNYEHMVLATLYSQIAAENKALQYQAFNLSKSRIREFLKSSEFKGNEAIVIDVDETILETSIFQVKMILENVDFSEGWDDFINSSSCEPVSGALNFLNFVDSLGIKIFYVSNRKHKQLFSLITNLNKYDFPQINESNIFLRMNSADKEKRREKIVAEYNVLLLIGDSLGDFSNIFEESTHKEIIQKVKEFQNLFGDKFIILPNASYGTWENLIYDNDWSKSHEVRYSLRKNTLKKIFNEYKHNLKN